MSRICVGSIGRKGMTSDAAAMLNMFPKLELVLMSKYFMMLPHGAAPLEDAGVQHAEPALEQHDVGGVARHVHRGRDGDADVGGVQRRRIVDAVAEIADDVPAPLEREQDAQLLARRHAREHAASARRAGPSAASLTASSCCPSTRVASRRPVRSHTWRVTAASSPVRILTTTPSAASCAMAAPASARGGSAKVSSPSKAASRSSLRL